MSFGPTKVSDNEAHVPLPWAVDHGTYVIDYIVVHNSDWWQALQTHIASAGTEPGTPGGAAYWVQRLDLLPITATAGSVPVYNASGALEVTVAGEPQVQNLDATEGVSGSSVSAGVIQGTGADGSTFQFDPAEGLFIAQVQETGPAKTGTLTPAHMRGIAAAGTAISELNPALDYASGAGLISQLTTFLAPRTIAPYDTVTLLEAVEGVDGYFYECKETETLYRCIAAGSAYTVDNLCVLSTHLGGNTRFVGVYGKYVYHSLNVSDGTNKAALTAAILKGLENGAPTPTDPVVKTSNVGLVRIYADITAAKAATSVDGLLCYVKSLDNFYRGLAAGSAYTANDTSVLTTGDAGNTRWIGRGPKYLVDGFSASGPVYIPDIALTLTDSAVAPNMALGNNFTLTLAGTDTLSNPTGHTVGQSGRIVIRQPAAGSKTLAFGSYYLFSGGVDGTVASAANAISVLYYDVLSSTEISCELKAGLA